MSARSDSPSHGLEPSKPAIYHAIYSGVAVYEGLVKDVFVMKRAKDSYMNATQILKVAGLNKAQRTKIIERELLQERHERVQVGRYMGPFPLTISFHVNRAALDDTRALGKSYWLII